MYLALFNGGGLTHAVAVLFPRNTASRSARLVFTGVLCDFRSVMNRRELVPVFIPYWQQTHVLEIWCQMFSLIKHFLWWCSGATVSLLERDECETERSKYA